MPVLCDRVFANAELQLLHVSVNPLYSGIVHRMPLSYTLLDVVGNVLESKALDGYQWNP